MSFRKYVVLIDFAHLFLTARTLGFKIDYGALRAKIAESGYVVRYNFFAQNDDSQEYQTLRPLLDWLDYNGYEVITTTGEETAHLAGLLHVAAFEMVGKTDEILIVAGANWYVPLVQFLKRQGMRVTVVSSLKVNAVSDELRRAGDEFVEIDSWRKSIEYIPKK